jgi:hypothetical protein
MGVLAGGTVNSMLGDDQTIEPLRLAYPLQD